MSWAALIAPTYIFDAQMQQGERSIETGKVDSGMRRNVLLINIILLYYGPMLLT